MKIDILTLFPSMFKGPFEESMVKRAQDKSLVRINIHNLRNWATDKHKTVDNRPYGGGKGMILKVNVVDAALQELRLNNKKAKVILLTPQGKIFSQTIAQKFSKLKHIILICGHYEGFDERIKTLVDLELSIGNYVLTGGELPAMVITDTIVRLLPGVLDPEASKHESFTDGKTFDFPQYTRPEEYKGMNVPKILLSGHHKKINDWRKNKQKTAKDN